MLVVHDVASVLVRSNPGPTKNRSVPRGNNYVQPRAVLENDPVDGGQRSVNVRAIRWLAADVDAPLSKAGCCQIPENSRGKILREETNYRQIP